MLDDKRKDSNLNNLISIGIGGLHTLNCAFENGENATGWNLKKLLSSTSKKFDESPSYHADYKKILSALKENYLFSNLARKMFCKKRQSIWEKIFEIVEYWKSLPKHMQPTAVNSSSNKSYKNNFWKIIKTNLYPYNLLSLGKPQIK